MVEKWKEAFDEGEFGGALLKDPLKAFDCIKHDLLKAKLAAFGFYYHLLNFILNYFTEKKQKTKLQNSYSPYADIECEFPQGSVLSPLLFNVNICACGIASYADDNAPHVSHLYFNKFLCKLETCANSLFTWFKENYMKLDIEFDLSVF